MLPTATRRRRWPGARGGLALAVLVAVAGLPGPPARAQPSAASLTVSVAVSLRPVVGEALPAFERRHPGVAVSINAGGSGVLVQQVRHGAPVDLLIAASPDELDRLERESLLARPRVTLASNRLVVVAPHDRAPPRVLADLLASDRIAVGNPRTAPVGRYAAQALARSGLAAALRPKLVYAENARQLIEYVARGEVDAALVYRSDALAFGDRLVVGPEVPAGAHEPIVYQGAVLARSPHVELAAEFLELLHGAEGSAILRRHGFGPAHEE